MNNVLKEDVIHESELHLIYQKRDEKLSKAYEQGIKRKFAYIFTLLIILGILLLVGLSVGGASFDIRESWASLIGGIRNSGELTRNQKIIWSLRVPRVLMAIVSGAGLAIAGLIMQTILRNPLASPFTLGISEAASFGAAFSIVSGMSVASILGVTLPKTVNISLNSFVFCSICTFSIYALSKTGRVTSETIVLFGVAMNFLFSAATAFMQYIGTEEELAELVYWMFGSLSKTTWSKLQIATVIFVICALLMYIRSWNFNALLLGDETAGSLGINVERLRIYGLILTSMLTAVIVSLLGPIGFIGLVAPHLSRILIGTNHKFLIPMSCLMGSVLLLGADIFGNIILAPQIVPVGIVTSFVGVPLLVYLVTRRRAEYW